MALALTAACSSSDDDTAGSTGSAATASTEPSATDPAIDSATDTTAAPTTTITPPDPLPVEPPEGMELVWADEFDGDTIDRTNWTFDLGGGGWGNGEAQYYTDRPENARVENGLLVIELREEKIEDNYYSSARLKSQGLREFQYGRVEARIRVPRGAGTWPAFWMLGADFDNGAADPSRHWPNVGEIDIMEYVGREPDLLMGTAHGPGYSGAGGLTRWIRLDAPLADDFHLFAAEWDETGIRWFFDGEQYYELTPEVVGNREWVFDRPFFIILNMALGGTLGGNIALDLEFPIQYYVDHVRVYQRVDGTGTDAVTDPSVDGSAVPSSDAVTTSSSEP